MSSSENRYRNQSIINIILMIIITQYYHSIQEVDIDISD